MFYRWITIHSFLNCYFTLKQQAIIHQTKHIPGSRLTSGVHTAEVAPKLYTLLLAMAKPAPDDLYTDVFSTTANGIQTY